MVTLYFFYKKKIFARKYKISSTDERPEIFRVGVQLYQHGSQQMSVHNLQN